jgi:hypothetical protein
MVREAGIELIRTSREAAVRSALNVPSAAG